MAGGRWLAHSSRVSCEFVNSCVVACQPQPMRLCMSTMSTNKLHSQHKDRPADHPFDQSQIQANDQRPMNATVANYPLCVLKFREIYYLRINNWRVAFSVCMWSRWHGPVAVTSLQQLDDAVVYVVYVVVVAFSRFVVLNNNDNNKYWAELNEIVVERARGASIGTDASTDWWQNKA